MSYADHFASHLRLTLLRILAEAPQFKANSSLLCDAADSVGVSASRDRVKTELAWLAEQQLVTIVQPTSGLLVATLTERGADVASGRSSAPGVQRPSPRG